MRLGAATFGNVDPAERQTIVEGVAALVVSLAEVGVGERDALRQLVVNLTQLGALDPSLVREAVVAVGHLPRLAEGAPEDAPGVAADGAPDTAPDPAADAAPGVAADASSGVAPDAAAGVQRPVDDGLGAPSTEESLVAALQGREWLELLAARLEE